MKSLDWRRRSRTGQLGRGAAVRTGDAAVRQRPADPDHHQGPDLARSPPSARPAISRGTLTHAGAAYPIAPSPRGITRLKKDVCQFPPLRVEFPQRPPAGSLFDGQSRLKLVTHCRGSADFQQKVLLEYAAYRLYNLLTPQSFRARLANIDYVDDSGKPIISRSAFSSRTSTTSAGATACVKPVTPDRIPAAQLDPRGSARFAVFSYMIGNLDWSMRAGPAGEGCCHNARLLAPPPVRRADDPGPLRFRLFRAGRRALCERRPRDAVSSVRQRNYRGYCMHNADAAAVAAEMARRRGELLGLFSDHSRNGRTHPRTGDVLPRRLLQGHRQRQSIFKTCVS